MAERVHPFVGVTTPRRDRVAFERADDGWVLTADAERGAERGRAWLLMIAGALVTASGALILWGMTATWVGGCNGAGRCGIWDGVGVLGWLAVVPILAALIELSLGAVILVGATRLRKQVTPFAVGASILVFTLTAWAWVWHPWSGPQPGRPPFWDYGSGIGYCALGALVALAGIILAALAEPPEIEFEKEGD